MSSDDVLTVRVDSLEESRREQTQLNKTITDSLHRIELALSQSVAKACPLPGHCVVLENSVKAKWDGDKVRFERLEKRLAENDEWHKLIESRMDTKLDIINDKFTAINRTLWGAAGAVGVIMALAPFFTQWVNHFLTLHRP